MARKAGVLAPLVALFAGALLLFVGARAADDDRGIVASLVSRALSSRATQVSIGAVDGALSSDVTIRDVVLSDRGGPWLKIDRARLVWSRAALLQRRVEVESLEIGALDWLRRPMKAPPEPKADAAEPILPELPLKVVVGAFAVRQLSLGEAVVGAAARLSASGSAALGPPSEGLDLRLEAHRLDAAGAFVARLGYVPQSMRLSLSLDFDEPPGGLVAHAADLPGKPPVKLSLHGEGPLDAFHAALDFAAGADIAAAGVADLARQGAGRRLQLDLRSRIAGLFPAVVAPVFAGETALQGTLFVADDGAVDVTGLSLASPSARLEIGGTVTAERDVDLKLHAGALPRPAAVDRLEIDARLQGPLAGPSAEAALKIENLHSTVGDLAEASAHISARPDGRLGDGATRIALQGEAAYGGLRLADPARRDLFGADAKMSFRGVASPEAVVQVANFDLESASLKAGFSGEVGAKRVHGEGRLEAPDLTCVARLSGLPLRGAASLKVGLDGSPERDAWTVELDGEASGLAFGAPVLDGFAAGALKLGGGVRAAGGGFGFDHLSLVGGHGRAALDGATDEGAIHAEIEIPEAKFLDPRVAGRASIAAELSGSLARLEVSAKADLLDGRLMDRPVSKLELSAVAHDVTGQPDAQLLLNGAIAGKPATGSLHVAGGSDGGWRLDGLVLATRSARLEGDLSLSPEMLAEGRLALNAADLDDLSPFALTKLSGALRGEAKLRGVAGRQSASLVATSAAASAGGASVTGLAVNLNASDLYGRPALDGAAGAARIVVGGETFSGVRIAAKAGAAGSEFDASATARGFSVEARGRLASDAARLQLASLVARGRGSAIRLAKPTTLAWGPDGLALDDLALAVGGGRLTLGGSVGSRLNLHATAVSLPLDLVDAVSPGLDLGGSLAGEATLGGASSAPEGAWRLAIDALTAPALRAAGVGPLRVAGAGRFAGGRTSLDATVAAAAGSLRLTGSTALRADGALDLRAAGRIDLAGANRYLAASGRRASGSALVDARILGTVAKLRMLGGVTITGGGFSDEASGFRLLSIEAALAAEGDEIAIQRFRATTPHDGALALEGRVRLDADAGFPGALKLTGRKAQLIATDVVTATADLALELNGPLARDPRIAGRIDVTSLDIGIPGKLSGALRPLEGARHIDPGPAARARLAIDARARAAVRTAAPFAGRLALTISAPSRVFLRGRGVDAEFGGRLVVGGTSTAPRIEGGFDLRRGSLALLGSRLTFSRGRVDFAGDAMPELDLTAQATTSDITAYVAVTGAAAKPAFAFTSSPSLPQDEILSHILFQKPSGSLSPFQALQVANAVASLSGAGDAFENVRKSLGVDSLDIGAGSTGGPAVGARRAIDDRLSLGVKTGARPEDNGVSLDLDVTRHLRLQGGFDASGGSTAGVGAQWEY